jgi:cytoskeletal protein RodZ
MNRTVLLGLLGGLSLAQAAFAQAPSTPTPPASSPQASSSSESRPDANYPRPSGQDSQPGKTAPKRAAGSSPDKGTVESRGSRTANQSAQVQGTAKQQAYKGNTGKKKDPGTACSTARATKNGGIDCGTGGTSGTPGKAPKP